MNSYMDNDLSLVGIFKDNHIPTYKRIRTRIEIFLILEIINLLLYKINTLNTREITDFDNQEICIRVENIQNRNSEYKTQWFQKYTRNHKNIYKIYIFRQSEENNGREKYKNL